jgi:hypothetical protein
VLHLSLVPYAVYALQQTSNLLSSTFRGVALAFVVWHDVTVPDESHSKRLRRESDELLATAAKLIEHAETLKAQAAELRKQIVRLDRRVKEKKT